MHENIDSFIKGYYEMRLFSTTPVPFPLVQMARTFLFLFVFSLPFVVLMDDGSSALVHCLAVFVMTFGFVGLEFVAIELDDPFGDDPNDFDNDGLALEACEDAYLTILDVDGPYWADKLRTRTNGNKYVQTMSTSLQNGQAVESNMLFCENMHDV